MSPLVVVSAEFTWATCMLMSVRRSDDTLCCYSECCVLVGNPYADESGAFGDNVFRFSLLSMAACEAPLVLPIGGYRQDLHTLLLM